MNQERYTVLFLITKATWGGAQKYVFDLATHLPQDTFEPVVAFGERGKLTNDLAASRIETVELPSLRRDVTLMSDIRSFFEVWRCLRSVRPDVLHLNSSKAAALGALAARMSGVERIIFTAHGWPFKESRSALARAAIYFSSWLTAFLSHAVIVVSREDEMLARRMWFIAHKLHYVPIGIEALDLFPREEAEQSLMTYGFRKSVSPRAVTIAELTKNKGLPYAIEAVALLKLRGVDLEYFIVGEGETRAELVKCAREKGVADRIHFLGFVKDAARYLKAFDIFVLPSIKEGMPYVLLEAAEAHLPIITTAAVNPAFIEGYEHVRAVSPADPRALADAIVETMREQEEKELFEMQEISPLSDMCTATLALY